MKAFWWFKDNSIAGMARPGFNAVHWFDLPFHEAVLLGWLGRYSSGPQSLLSFQSHLESYAPKIFQFYGLSHSEGLQELEKFQKTSALLDICNQLSKRTQIFRSFDISGDDLHFSLNPMRIDQEISFLKENQIKSMVSLTENQHIAEILRDHFKLHHIAIADLEAPKLEQVETLVEIIGRAQQNREKIAIHCLAGIGRTSTMLMAAHVLMGERPNELTSLLKKQNPKFVLTGPQNEFIRSLASSSSTR
jgi:protein-tyrosine phosphatase